MFGPYRVGFQEPSRLVAIFELKREKKKKAGGISVPRKRVKQNETTLTICVPRKRVKVLGQVLRHYMDKAVV